MSGRTSSLVNKKFLEFLFPTILTASAVSLAAVVDGIIVGNLLGKSALAAVGLMSPFIFGSNALFALFAVGGITCASIALGERSEEEANRFFSTCLYVGLATMILYALAVTLLAQPICIVLACGDVELAQDAASYITSLIWAGPFMMFALASAQFWKIEGAPTASTRVSIIANVVNLVLDFVLIRYFNMGIAGAGLSTMLGYMIGALFALGYYRWPKRSFRFLRPSRWMLPCMKEIFGKGVYRFITSLSGLAQSLVLNTLVATAFGADGLTVLTVCINALMIAIIFVSGAAEALQPIVATLFGEKDVYGIRAVFRRALAVTMALCISLTALYVAFPEFLGMLFGIADGIDMLDSALRLYSAYIPLYTASQLLQVMYNNTGHNKRSVIMSVLEGLILINGYALLLFCVNQPLIFLCYALGCATMLLLTICWAAFTRRRTPELHGLMLLPAQKERVPWETTLSADNEHAVLESANIIDFCEACDLPKRLANRMAVAVEEMVVNTAAVNADGSEVTIDVLVRMSDDEILLIMRDNGVLFNPLAYHEDDLLNHDGIDLVVKMAASVNYSHHLGFNITTMGFMRPKVVA